MNAALVAGAEHFPKWHSQERYWGMWEKEMLVSAHCPCTIVHSEKYEKGNKSKRPRGFKVKYPQQQSHLYILSSWTGNAFSVAALNITPSGSSCLGHSGLLLLFLRCHLSQHAKPTMGRAAARESPWPWNHSKLKTIINPWKSWLWQDNTIP